MSSKVHGKVSITLCHRLKQGSLVRVRADENSLSMALFLQRVFQCLIVYIPFLSALGFFSDKKKVELCFDLYLSPSCSTRWFFCYLQCLGQLNEQRPLRPEVCVKIWLRLRYSEVNLVSFDTLPGLKYICLKSGNSGGA